MTNSCGGEGDSTPEYPIWDARDQQMDNSSEKAVATTLKRNLNLANVVAMMLALTGHVSIFITPGSIISMAGSILSTFIYWFFGSFLVYSLALCFAELGTIFPQAGGPYLYMTKVFGPFHGFMLAWGYIVMISGPFIAFASHTTSVYIVKAVLSDSFCQNEYYEVAILVLSVWILASVVFLNCNFLRLVTQAQTILTGCKIAAIFIIIFGGLYTLATESTDNYKEPTASTSHEPGKISLALLYVIFSNGGWQAVISLTEEIKNPARVLPMAIHLTFAIYVFIVAMTFAAYIVVLDLNQIANTDAVALLFCRHLWPPLIPVMSVLVSLASIGALNVGIMGHSRVILAVARRGTLPRILSTIHVKHSTPMAGIVIVGSYGTIMLMAGGTTKMMQFIGLFSLMLGLKMIFALLYLRYTKPDLHRPYKVFLLYPILNLFVSLSLFVLVIYQEPSWMFVGILIYLAGIPVYLFAATKQIKPKAVTRLIGNITRTFQKCFQLVPS